MGRSVVVERRLASEASSVGEARRIVRAAAAEAEVTEVDWVDNALVAVSEVVTNALVHAGTPISLTVRVDRSGIRVEVSDGSTNLPRSRGYAITAGTGRGLSLVAELVHAWGTALHAEGKVVWFELGSAKRSARGAPGPAGPPAPGPAGQTQVVLLDVPLLTHAAWQEHAAALLREYLLTELDAESADEAAVFAAHAAASDAMTVLFEQIPAPVLGDDPDAIMATATEPGVTGRRVVLSISAETVGHFAVLNQLMDAAAGFADAGVWLTAPTQPELRAQRRWICAEVRRQSAGEAPQAWRVPDDLPLPPAPTLPDWDRATVTASERSLVAADDTDRIVAVSPAALDLLGYDRADELVGQRLLAIIPWRFHQAHLAGFTLHLTNGRAPLMDRPVTVPVLRRDGAEQLADLMVTSARLPHGRHLFTAEITRHEG